MWRPRTCRIVLLVATILEMICTMFFFALGYSSSLVLVRSSVAVVFSVVSIVALAKNKAKVLLWVFSFQLIDILFMLAILATLRELVSVMAIAGINGILNVRALPSQSDVTL